MHGDGSSASLPVFLRFLYKRMIMILLEDFLEIIREVLKGILREISAFFFRKYVLENKKTTLRRRKQKGGISKS
jgi:hypothetical protein